MFFVKIVSLQIDLQRKAEEVFKKSVISIKCDRSGNKERTRLLCNSDFIRRLVLRFIFRFLRLFYRSSFLRFGSCRNRNWRFLLVLLEHLPLDCGQLHSVTSIRIGFGVWSRSDSFESLVLYQYGPQSSRDLQNILTTLG